MAKKRVVKNTNKAITISLPNDKGEVSRSEGSKFAFKDTLHLASYLATVGLNSPTTPEVENIFERPAFMPGWLDGKYSGAESRGLVLSIAVFDLDKEVHEATIAALRELPFEMVWYATRSGEPHYRLLVTINRPIKMRAELAAMAAMLNERIGGGIDVTSLKALNHLHDVPLACRGIEYKEGTAFDVEGVAFAGVEIPKIVDDVADPEMVSVPGGPADALKHFEAVINKQIAVLEEVPVGIGIRHATCARIGSICGQAWQAAVDKGATPLPGDDLLAVMAHVIDSREFTASDAQEYKETIAKQFEWGVAHPFARFGEVRRPRESGLDELERNIRRMKNKPDALERNLIIIGEL